MKFAKSWELPSRGEFLKKFLEAIFPDIEQLITSKKKESAEEDEEIKPYGWTMACAMAAKELGLIQQDDFDEELVLREDQKLFVIMYELAQSCKYMLNSFPDFRSKSVKDEHQRSKMKLNNSAFSRMHYDGYMQTMFTFCDSYNGSIKNWLDNPDGAINSYLEATLFFSYLLLERNKSRENRENFFKYCLDLAGINDIEDVVNSKLFDFESNINGKKCRIDDVEFVRCGNKAIILFVSTVAIILKNIGRKNEKTLKADFEKLHSLFTEIMAGEVKTQEEIDGAQKALYSNIKFFDPRSISTPKKFLPDYFVMPCFDGELKSPAYAIKDAQKSSRSLISAKTGLGKSIYLQMLSLCILNSRYTDNDNVKMAINSLTESLNVPNGLFVISIPARMFSFCYRDAGKYREWTTDLIKLYFNCMWKISGSNDFYSPDSSQRTVTNVVNGQYSDAEVSDELYDYIKYLAYKGKLLLILDSFDEISSGEMRNAYLKAVASFYDNYCYCLEEKEVGAHVIISSREMSNKTMGLLKDALALNEDDVYGILQLNMKQRKELVHKWITDTEDAKDILNTIENNHYYLDYSVNPYMLSVVCYCAGYGLSKITQRFIETLINRMMRNNRNTEDVLQNVLFNIEKILQDIAGETVINGKPHFSRQKLARYFIKFIDKNDRSNEDVEQYIEKLHEIFVTEVGLIVPADGEDSDYQFINDQIRYELAAKGIQRALENDERTLVYKEVILPSIKDVEEYVGLIIPFICEINLQNVQLAEILVSDLAFYDFKDEKEDALLKRAMLDLLLNRYGDSIITVLISDDIYVRRAQRKLLMRLLTSPSLKLTDEEHKEFIESHALQGNRTWISQRLLFHE